MAENIGPYSQDILTLIYNVQWGGGTFVAGDFDSNIHCLKLGAWTNLGKLDFVKDEGDYFTGFVQGCAYARVGDKPVYVLVGGGASSHSRGIIMASNDGLNWARVFSYGESSDSFVGAVIFGVVWDANAQAFYAGGRQSDNEVEWESQTDLLFSSPDGLAWRIVDRHVTRIEHPDATYPEYKTGLLAAHCSGRVKDENSNGVPDGVYGYAKDQLLIAPEPTPSIGYLTGDITYPLPGTPSPGTPTPGASVKITNLSTGAEPYLSEIGTPTFCVASTGGQWMAAGGVFGNPAEGGAGGSCLAYVLTPVVDGPPVWKSLNPGGASPIITMTAGR
jgi:hypothetical protein